MASVDQLILMLRLPLFSLVICSLPEGSSDFAGFLIFSGVLLFLIVGRSSPIL